MPRKPGSRRADRPDPLLAELAEMVVMFPDAPLVTGRRYRNHVKIDCPYCPTHHWHGGFGHRTPHCGWPCKVSPEAKDIGYNIVPARLISQLMAVAREVRHQLASKPRPMASQLEPLLRQFKGPIAL